MKLCDCAAFLGSSFNSGHVDYLKKSYLKFTVDLYMLCAWILHK